jgi:hypothetical protein
MLHSPFRKLRGRFPIGAALLLFGGYLAFFAACSEPELEPSAPTISLTTELDGTPWTATFSPYAPRAAVGMEDRSPISIEGYSGDDNHSIYITLSLFNIRGPGRFPLGVASMVVGGYANVHESWTHAGIHHSWSTPYTGKAGEAVITEIAGERIKGTFSFYAVPSTNTPAGTLRMVTNGRFDLPLGGVVFGLLKDNKGSSLSARMGDSAYSPISIVGRLVDSAGNEGVYITTNSPEHGLDILLDGVSAPGTYALVASRPKRVLRKGRTDIATGYCCWGTEEMVEGEVTISSFSPSRVKGLFHATLGPQDGALTGNAPIVTEGTFDVGIGF